MKSDFILINNISLYLLMPMTKKAKQWVEENIELDEWQSRRSIAIEPRYVADIKEGIKESGLTIN